MLCSLLSLPPEAVRKLDEYAMALSTGISPALKSHFAWTTENFPDADRASSLSQAQWMLQKARDMGAEYVLDIGCYTGLSAVAWHQGTTETQAKVVTIESNHELATQARARFASEGYNDRIQVLEALAEDALQELTAPFDILFVDLEFSAYLPIVKEILDRRLLSPNGVIIVDNVFARGFVVGFGSENAPHPVDTGHWERAGNLVREFNHFVASDCRVDVNLLPIFDGVAEIRWKSRTVTDL